MAVSILASTWPTYAGILQAEAYAGFSNLYNAGRKPGPITEAACCAHGRRKFYVLADVAKAPIALEAVRRIDTIFDLERDINGRSPEQRLAARAEHVRPLVDELEAWMRGERASVSRHNDLSRAMDYMLKRWPSFTRFLATAGSASATTPRNAPSEGAPSAAAHGCSPDPTGAASVPPTSTA